MPHCDPEQLALAALAEPLPADDAGHLASCAQCQAEVASLRRPVDVLAVPSLSGTAPEVAPPPRVWEAIAAATGVSAAPTADADDAQVLELRPRRSRGRWLTLAAAVLVGGVVGGAVVALNPDQQGAVVAQTALDPLAADDASGRAEVRESGGSRSLQVDLDAPDLDDGYYEVWVMQPDAVRMVPVGVVMR